MRILNLIFLFLYCSLTNAQVSIKENLWEGTGIYKLGADISLYESNLLNRQADSIQFNSQNYVPCEYQLPKDSFFSFAGIKIKSNRLNFNSKKKLSQISLSSSYKDTSSIFPFQNFYSDIKVVSKYMRKKIGNNYIIDAQNNNDANPYYTFMWEKNRTSIYLHVKLTDVPSANFKFGLIDITIIKKE